MIEWRLTAKDQERRTREAGYSYIYKNKEREREREREREEKGMYTKTPTIHKCDMTAPSTIKETSWFLLDSTVFATQYGFMFFLKFISFPIVLQDFIQVDWFS